MAAQKKDLKQLAAFKKVARELECDESDDALERVFSGINPKKQPEGLKSPENKPSKN